jgi:pSer/pThr/pTyr-binding forkhead associated (FHA) protein
MSKSPPKKLSDAVPPAGSPLRLILQVMPGDGKAPKILATPLKDRLVVGRSSLDTPVSLDIDLLPFDAANAGVSRQHALFHFIDGSLCIEDLDSTNGTRINGFQIQGGRQYKLRNGDELEIGRMRLIVHVIRAPH